MFGCVKGLESSPLRTNNKVVESCEFLVLIIITSNIEIKLRNKHGCFCVNIVFVISVAKYFFYLLETSGSFFLFYLQNRLLQITLEDVSVVNLLSNQKQEDMFK